jgi:hypothetical protein
MSIYAFVGRPTGRENDRPLNNLRPRHAQIGESGYRAAATIISGHRVFDHSMQPRHRCATIGPIIHSFDLKQ